MRLKSQRWQRERTVGNILCTSVVAITKILGGGGSSNVLSRALKASTVSICASSRIYTLYLPVVGGIITFSRSSRILSIPRLEAASISTTLKEFPAVISRHCSHTLQGSPFFDCEQLIVFAKRRAVLVLPVPLGPVKR